MTSISMGRSALARILLDSNYMVVKTKMDWVENHYIQWYGQKYTNFFKSTVNGVYGHIRIQQDISTL